MKKLTFWWQTSIENRIQDIRNKIIARNGEKYTAKDLAYENYNYGLGKARCENCVFFQGDRVPCEIIQTPIYAEGLCHFIAGRDQIFAIERVYAVLPPNGTWFIGIGAFLAATTILVVRRKKK